jgi:peroxiredoxin
MQAAGQRTGGKVKVEKFVITTDWTAAKVDPTGSDEVTDGELTFKPGKGEAKVDEFHIGDGDDSLQHKLLNQPAPEFAATTLDGKPWSLKDQAGKVVVLQFWSASKGSSVASLQVFNSMDMVYKDRGVVMVGVNEDHASLIEQSKATAKRKLAAYTMLADGGKLVGNAYRVANLPCTILIDKGGIIRSITTDFDAADQVLVAGRLDRLLAGLPLDDGATPAPFRSPNKLQTAPGATPPATEPPAAPKPSEPAADPKKP